MFILRFLNENIAETLSRCGVEKIFCNNPKTPVSAIYKKQTTNNFTTIKKEYLQTFLITCVQVHKKLLG